MHPDKAVQIAIQDVRSRDHQPSPRTSDDASAFRMLHVYLHVVSAPTAGDRADAALGVGR